MADEVAPNEERVRAAMRARSRSPVFNRLEDGEPDIQGSSNNITATREPDDIISLFMPNARAGASRPCSPQRLAANMIIFILLSLALAVTCMGVLCFASHDSGACYFYIPPIEKYFKDQASFDRRNMWRLMQTVMFTLATALTYWSLNALATKGLNMRRTTRLRRRVVGAMSGVTSRSEATRKLMSGMRSIMDLVHECARPRRPRASLPPRPPTHRVPPAHKLNGTCSRCLVRFFTAHLSRFSSHSKASRTGCVTAHTFSPTHRDPSSRIRSQCSWALVAAASPHSFLSSQVRNLP